MGKRIKIENPYLNAQLHINMCLHIEFQENPLNGLDGVAIKTFFLLRTLKGRKSALKPFQKKKQKNMSTTCGC